MKRLLLFVFAVALLGSCTKTEPISCSCDVSDCESLLNGHWQGENGLGGTNVVFIVNPNGQSAFYSNQPTSLIGAGIISCNGTNEILFSYNESDHYWAGEYSISNDTILYLYINHSSGIAPAHYCELIKTN